MSRRFKALLVGVVATALGVWAPAELLAKTDAIKMDCQLTNGARAPVQHGIVFPYVREALTSARLSRSVYVIAGDATQAREACRDAITLLRAGMPEASLVVLVPQEGMPPRTIGNECNVSDTERRSITVFPIRALPSVYRFRSAIADGQLAIIYSTQVGQKLEPTVGEYLASVTTNDRR